MRFEFDLFLSHNSRDKPRVRRLAEKLRETGLRVWFDEWCIRHGDDIFLAIEEGLKKSRTFVLCLSRAGLESEWVSMERSSAMFRDPTNRSRRFVPVLLEDCELPATIKRFRYLDFRNESPSSIEQFRAACTSARFRPVATSKESSVDEVHSRLRIAAGHDDAGLKKRATAGPQKDKRPLIVVAEDIKEILVMIKVVLTRAGFRVLAVNDGNKALRAAQTHRPAAVVLDYHMPKMSGIEVMTQLRRDEATRDIPVIINTERSEYLSATVGLEAGANDFLPKPFVMSELIARLRRLIKPQH